MDRQQLEASTRRPRYRLPNWQESRGERQTRTHPHQTPWCLGRHSKQARPVGNRHGSCQTLKQKMLKYSAEFVPVLQAEDAEVSGPDPQTDGSDDEVISEDEDAVDTTTVGADDAKSIAALVAYMVGGATTDGAILHLMEKLIGADNNGVADGEDRITTHWCNAHRISLLSRFAFAQKTNERIQPLKTCFRLQMAKLTDVLMAHGITIPAQVKKNYVHVVGGGGDGGGGEI